MIKHNLEPTDKNLADLFEIDALGRNENIKQFVEFLDKAEDNFVMALDGEWGSGKTFFIKTVQTIINQSNEDIAIKGNDDCDRILNKWRSIRNNKAELSKKQIAVYYDAWENDNADNPITSLLYSLSKSTGTKPETAENLTAIAENIIRIIDKRKINNIVELLNNLKQNSTVDEEAKENLHSLVSDYLTTLIAEKHERLIIFVDELDRCKPNYAVEFLEKIKHYFNKDNITFVFALNINELRHTISNYYGSQFDGVRYLDKFFDIRVSLRKPTNLNGYLKLIGVMSTTSIHDAIMLKCIEHYSFELREISRYIKIIKIANANYMHLGINSSIGFLHNVFVPILLAIKMKEPNKFNNVINGTDKNAISDVLIQLEQKHFIEPLLTNEEREIEINEELIKQKISEVSEKVFPPKRTGEKRIGQITFNGYEGDEIIKTCSLMSDTAIVDFAFE